MSADLPQVPKVDGGTAKPDNFHNDGVTTDAPVEVPPAAKPAPTAKPDNFHNDGQKA